MYDKLQYFTLSYRVQLDSGELHQTHLFWERWTHFQMESSGLHWTPPDFSPLDSH